MSGLIWFVQLVHYPQFADIGGGANFAAYHKRHTRLTSYVVIAPMLIEAVTATLLLFLAPVTASRSLLWIGAALVGVIWISTSFLQIPRHKKLGVSFDGKVCSSLCATNWIRTFAWSARAILMTIVAAQ